MRIETAVPKGFQAITIVVETQGEAEALASLLYATGDARTGNERRAADYVLTTAQVRCDHPEVYELHKALVGW